MLKVVWIDFCVNYKILREDISEINGCWFTDCECPNAAGMDPA